MIKRDPRFIDLTGKVFGRLTIERLHESRRTKCGAIYYRWLCRCSCGKEKIADGGNIRAGKTTSCGCYLIDVITKHGNTLHPLHKTWKGMIQRCYNPAANGFSSYGGRGIQVCSEWRESFEAFCKDVGERPGGCTLDRIEADGDYQPSNCRWSTTLEQALGKRTTYRVSLHGAVLPLSRAMQRLGFTPGAAYARMRNYGMSAQQATDFFLGKAKA